MKRIKSLMLLFAFVLLLTGSAWAGNFPTASADLSFDIASGDAISFIEGDFKSPKVLSGEVKLSADKISVDKGLKVINVVISKDKGGFSDYNISRDLSVDVYLVGSKDVSMKFDEAFKLSDDKKASNDLYVPFPIVLFDLGADPSSDVVLTSGDAQNRVSKVTFYQVHSKDLDSKMKLNGLYVADKNSGDIKVVTLSNDVYKAFNGVPSSKDTYFVVRNGATAKASMDLPVMLKVSADVASDLMVTKWQWGSKNLAYGILSKDVKDKRATSNDVVLEPMRMMSSTDVSFDVVKVSAYNVTKKAYSDTVQLKNYLMASDAVVNYHVGEKVITSKDVKFADPSTWVATKLTSADFNKVSADISADIDFILSGDKSGDVPAVTWYTSSDWKTSYDFSKNDIVVTALDLYASYDKTAAKEEEEGDETPTFAIESVTATASPTSVSVDVSFDVTATLKLSSGDVASADKVTYTLLYSGSTLATVTNSADKATLSTKATAAMYPSADLTVRVEITYSGDVVASKDSSAVTITILSADSTPDDKKEDEGGKGDDTGDDTPKEGATADEAKTEAAKEIKNLLATSPDATVADLLNSATFVANVTKNVSSGTLDMGVLNGFTTLKNLSQLLTKLAGNGTSVTALNFATITTVTTIAAGDLDGVKVTTMDFSANTSVTTASFKGATITGTLNLSGAVHKVATVDLAGATVDTVDMKSSGVTSATLDASSDVKKIDANGSDLATIELAGNDNIQELDVGGTSVSDLDAAGCEGLTTLGAEGGTSTGAGSLQNLDVTGCKNLTNLTVTNNKLLGIAADSTTKRPTTFSARGQGRSAPSSFTFSRTFSLISLLRSILGSTPTFTITSTTVTSIVGGTNNTGTITDSGDITFSSMPTQLKYDYNPTFAAASSTEFAASAEDGMDVTISANAGTEEEAKLPSSSGGGCDAGFGFGALAALMAVFALKKRR